VPRSTLSAGTVQGFDGRSSRPSARNAASGAHPGKRAAPCSASRRISSNDPQRDHCIRDTGLNKRVEILNERPGLRFTFVGYVIA